MQTVPENNNFVNEEDRKINWNSIFGHKWSSELYEMGVSYLKNAEIPIQLINKRHDVRNTFIKRMKPYDVLNDELILKSYSVPFWLTNNDKNPILLHTLSYPIIFKVVSK